MEGETQIPGDPHHLAADEGVAAIRADAEVERDVAGGVCEHVADGEEPAGEIDGLGLVLEEEADVRDEERLLHELLVKQRAAYGIDRLFGLFDFSRWLDKKRDVPACVGRIAACSTPRLSCESSESGSGSCAPSPSPPGSD